MPLDGLDKVWQQVQEAAQQFNAQAFLSTVIGRKVERYVGTLFDGIGEENIHAMMAEDANLSDYIADKEKERLKMLVMPYVKIVAELDPAVMYTWLPDKYRELFESSPQGREWGVRQLQIIKKLLTS